ncbi:MAG: glutamine synthetase III [Firmicutes bacterium]|nr:glutamine synthetase III [Bacillota bacterium]
MPNVAEYFAENVFNDAVMKQMLSDEVYSSVQQTISNNQPLDPTVADAVAAAMKEWAIARGVTHYTHWFQPMTGVTAEKHDSFISPDKNGGVIMEFRGKELIKGEPDASSFPSGGLRATFEARGYTAWDPTSFAFIKDNVLCIPTVFCSYGGQSLDKKTPLLRSMRAIDKQALRVLRLFGNTRATGIVTNVGPEQEYFLVDKQLHDKRRDLIFCGRTLFGARPPKGQELDDHYFGALKPRVAAFMTDIDHELWKLGVLAKTEHNEVAPAQHELAPIFSTTNIATDHNQLTMEIMKKVAARHGLVCLLHEKPFENVNGSGKHNNWSLSTNYGKNLLDPGDSPAENAQFLLFLTAVIKAVDEHQDLLRISVADAGNDHRLGGNEAPPAIVSMFLGSELTAILESIESGTPYSECHIEPLKIGVDNLPVFPRDTTDRNRTSPFAFTGNKFEFRMLGSSASIACTNIMLNTMVADVLGEFADELEAADDFNEALNALIKRTITEHKRIIFNGDGYSDEWQAEAERRGLLNLPSTVDCLPLYITEENISMFGRHGVFTPDEMHSRYEILLEKYIKNVKIEALTAVDMINQEIVPACQKFMLQLTQLIAGKQAIGVDISLESERLNTVSKLTVELDTQCKRLSDCIENPVIDSRDSLEVAKFCRNEILTAMADARSAADKLELMVSKEFWPFPTYDELLFNI